MISSIRRLELTILVTVVTIAVMIFISGIQFTTTTVASESGAPTGRTGAPGEGTCTDCHSQNAGNGQVNLIVPAGYSPGQTYSIQVQESTSDTTRAIWGFETISLAGSAMAGTFTNTSANTRIRVAGTKSYVTHTTAGTFPSQSFGANWSFNWTAPATNVGNVTFYAAGLLGDNDNSDNGDRTVTAVAVIPPQPAVVIHHGFADFDADGKADPSVFRNADGTWFMNRSTAGFAGARFGIAGDRPTPADFDGDDKADIAVWREAPANEAAFYILQSSNSTVRIEQFGQTGDNILPVGDWDGDGKADVAVYRDSAVSSQSYFYFRGTLNNPTGSVTYVPWGTTGDKPMRGDFDGDGKFDPAVFRNGVWYIRQSSNSQMKTDSWGLSTDKFVTADYDGDAKTDLAVFRNGVWYIKQSSDNLPVYFSWGLASDVLVPADYDGDGKTDVAVYRSGTWYIRSSSSGTMSAQIFGLSSDLPIPASFVQ